MAEAISGLYKKLLTPRGYVPPLECFIDPARRLSPLHRAELIEEMEKRGIPVPDRTLVESDYYGLFGRLLTDVWAGSDRHKEWLKSNQHLVERLKENPVTLSRMTAVQGPDDTGPPGEPHAPPEEREDNREEKPPRGPEADPGPEQPPR